jgi:hypothetical protein
MVGKSEGMRPLGRTRHVLMNNIETDFGEERKGIMDCTELAEARKGWRAFVNTIMNLGFP